MLLALTQFAGITEIFALVYASGWIIDCVGRSQLTSAAPDILMSRLGIGSIAWAYFLFVLACVGAYRASFVLPLAATVPSLAVGLALSNLPVARRTRESARTLARRLADPAACNRNALFSVIPALVLSVVFVAALSPSVGWDDDVYHLTLPKLYLESGGFRRVPLSVYSHWPHSVELIFGFAMMLDDYVLAKLVHVLFLTFVVMAIYRQIRKQASHIIASAATLLFLGNDVVLFEGTVANVDIAVAFYFLMAVDSAEHYLKTDDTRRLVLSGVFCGAMAGTKLSGLAGIACVMIGLCISRLDWLQKPWRILVVGLSLGLPTALLAFPWYAKTYLYTGNPFYPMFYESFGGPEWSQKLSSQFFGWQHSMGMGRSLRDYLLLPLRVIFEAGYGYEQFDGRVSKVWVAAIPISVFVACRTGRGSFRLICAGAYFIFWAMSSQQMRFLIPALPLLAIAAGQSADRICTLARSPVTQRFLRAAVLLGASTTVLSAAESPSLDGAWEDVRKFVEGRPTQRLSVVPEGYAYINQRTPKRARLMLLNTNRGFFLDREYIADSFPEASQLSWLLSGAESEAELLTLLDRMGITHLYVNTAKRHGMQYPTSLNVLLGDDRAVKRFFPCSRKRCVVYELISQHAR